LVAASVSSYGAFLYGEEYTGNYGGISDEDLAVFHRKQIHLLAGEKPDMLAIETVPCLQEVKVFLKLISEPEFEQLGVPIWIAVSCKDDSHMGSGEPITGLTDLIKELGSPKLLKSIGINCSPP
jgi:homocysteine S-methyltransferase